MHNLTVYKTEGFADIFPLSIKRDWMDDTWNSHAYHCFPVGLGNQLGWGISFPEDIVFIWDGISDTSSEHVKILKGEKYAFTSRANATISFRTGLHFKTNKDISIFQMPVPNLPRDGVYPFSTLMSTSFFEGELPCAWMITRPNVEITIKANTPIIAIIPLNLFELQDSRIDIFDISEKKDAGINMSEYVEVMQNLNNLGKWSNFYRNAIDHKNNKLGEHQVKAIKLYVQDNKNT